MPWNGSGVFQRVRNWVNDASSGVKIRADYHDSEDDSFAAGITNCIARDGQSTILANIPFNAKRITGLADPVNPQDAVTQAWVGANVTGGALIADAPPAAGKVGNLWWDSDQGGLYLRYDDGSSVQWVQVNVGSTPNGPLALAEIPSAPTTPADTGVLYAKDALGISPALYYRPENSGVEQRAMWTDSGPITMSGVPAFSVPMPPDTTMVDVTYDLVSSDTAAWAPFIRVLIPSGPLATAGAYAGGMSANQNALSPTIVTWTNTLIYPAFTGFGVTTGISGIFSLRRSSAARWVGSGFSTPPSSAVIYNSVGVLDTAGQEFRGIYFGVTPGTGDAGSVRVFYR